MSDGVLDKLPKVDELLKSLEFVDTAEVKYHSEKSTLSDTQIPSNEPIYCSVSEINGELKKVFLSEKEVSQEGLSYDLNPLIYYRLNSAIKDYAKLPKIDLSTFFSRSEDNRQIKFTVKKLSLDTDNKLIEKIKDEAIIKSFNQLSEFN